MLNKINDEKTAKLLRLIVFMSIGIIITLVALLLFAVLFTLLDLDKYLSGVFATVSLILGSFVSSYFYIAKINNKGLINGALLGLAIYLVTFIISLIISKNGFSLISLFHLICTVLSGAIAGILRVNKKSNMKYLK
ncbi:MAG: TIGR04086 family membrane protein [Ruminococcaceae bacterium]|nr:TIGR04086 family membrane protein [Oscillospiraceae bacterium]